VALEPPAAARERIVAWQHEALGGHGRSLRLVPPESLHVTLAFLGHHPEDQVDAIAAAALSRVAALPAPELSPVGVVPLPPRRPRLYAVDLADSDGRATAVHHAVAEPLVEGGWYEREQRPFWPHLTVARVRAGARAPDVAVEPPAAAVSAREVVLYRSRLGRGGAAYAALARVTLR
jgi:2'-5' RNA ligase